MNVPSTLKVLRSAVQTFSDELARLSPREWETPNACGDWTVADVVAHLTRGAEGYSLATRRALEGITEPPEGSSFITDRAAGSAGIFQRGRLARQQLGDDLPRAFLRSTLEFVELLESLQPRDWQLPVFHSVAIVPITSLVQWRLSEVSLHRWDVLNHLGHEAQLPDGSLEPLLDWLPLWFKICFNPGEVLKPPLFYRFLIGAPLDRTLGLVVHGDRFEVEHTWERSAVVAHETDPESFILLAMGRLAWPEALMSGRLRANGQDNRAEDFTRWFGTL